MLSLTVARPEAGLKILCLGAHCDDIEIGCGGTMLRLADESPIQYVKWVVFTSTPERAIEARASAEAFLHQIKGKEIMIKNFRDGFLFNSAAEVKNSFEELKSDFWPDIIFTHYRQDLHQDHRLLSDLTWNTFRDHLILEYEIPKYDGDIGNPNLFVSLPKSVMEKKNQFIMDHFGSQAGKHWFDKEVFSSLMRLRGMECASKTNYAEAFYAKKIQL